MKKIGNWPITEADTDFSILQKIKEEEKKIIPKNFQDFFPPFFTTFLFSFLRRSM